MEAFKYNYQEIDLSFYHFLVLTGRCCSKCTVFKEVLVMLSGPRNNLFAFIGVDCEKRVFHVVSKIARQNAVNYGRAGSYYTLVPTLHMRERATRALFDHDEVRRLSFIQDFVFIR
jgi:hypothetical protein